VSFKLSRLLSIIIVTYNAKYFTEQCLYSVQKAIAGMDAEVIVVDNSSGDESVAYLQKIFPWVNFIVNKENIGYASANNRGYQRAKGEYILFLNPDTLLSEDCLLASMGILEGNSNIGALGIHMIDGAGHFLPESKRGFPSVMASFFKLSGLTGLFPGSRTFGCYYLGWLPEKQDNEVEVLSGAFMMTKKAILDITGGFDEQFFMYGEDIDLSYRIQQAGYKNYYLGEKSIVHFKGESTRKDIRYTRLFYKAMIIFVKKHYGANAPAFNLLMQLAICLRGTLSFTRQLLPAKIKLASRNKFISTMLVGEPGDTKSAAEILISQPAANRKITAMADITGIRHVKTDELVFCAGKLSYTGIMEIMQQMANNGIAFLFSAAGSKSIVSSMSKKSNGEILVEVKSGIV
jgi:N-acetylglucosaminyl-diphospho-decaprenol L-rhamnosyltransferase